MVTFGDARLPARFWAKVEIGSPPEYAPHLGPCWLWTASLNSTGRGQFYWQGGPKGSHRVAYEQLIGPVLNGLEIDHLCRVIVCANPGHLEAVTRRENIMRGIGPALQRARHAAITHCPQGHPYDEANTWRGSDGRRKCRACGLASGRRSYWRNPDASRRRYLQRKERLHAERSGT